MFLADKTLGAILIGKDLLNAIGDTGLDTFKLSNAHRPELLTVVAMHVLAAPNARLVGLALADSCQIDKHSVARVDPASIDDIHAIATGDIDVVGVDVEQVRLGHGLIGGVGEVVGVLGPIKVLS